MEEDLRFPIKKLPDYGFDHEPTEAEMRAMTIRVMHDMLTIPWHTASGYTYQKTGAVAGKTFVFAADETYIGLPYTNAQRTLFGMLRYLDPETGALLEDKVLRDYREQYGEEAPLGTSVNRILGNTCTGSTGWAYSAVSSSVRGRMISYTLTKANGFYPVGDYDYPDEVRNLYQDTTTFKILEANGRAKMLECYALVKPADLVVQNGEDPAKGHSMMAILPAEVKRNADGVIDDLNSFITVQDQRAGFYDYDNGRGVTGRSSGRAMGYRASFEELFRQGYMPVSSAELLGRKAYVFPQIRLEGASDSFSSLEKSAVLSNFALAFVSLSEEGGDESEQVSVTRIFDREDIGNGEAFSYALSALVASFREELKKKGRAIKDCAPKLEVMNCAGKRLCFSFSPKK